LLLTHILEENGSAITNRKSTIMVCEDDIPTLQLIQQAIGSKYNTISVGSGRECLSIYIDERAKGNQIDVLLVDYELRDLPGDIIASTIREISGNRVFVTRTILIAGDEVDKQLIEDLKTKEYIIESLEKPICTDSLIAIIEEITA
jgi:CheY-like chemotaxis protein